MRCLITVGYFDTSGEGRLIEIDLARGSQVTRLAYIPPSELRVPEKGFTGAVWSGDPGQSTLFVCGASAVYQVDPLVWSVTEIWHQPCMNDLHHVAVDDDRVHVVNTGLEAVDVFSREGLFLGSHALHPGWLSALRQRGSAPAREERAALLDARWPRLEVDATASEPSIVDYYSPAAPGQLPFSQRKVRDYAHPNHVTVHGDRVLVTRFLDRAVDDLSSLRRVIAETPGLPHDGIAFEDRFWITCVNGLVVAYAIQGGQVTCREVERFDVFATGHSGWCRGLAVTRDHLVVGLTAIQRMPRARWCDRPFEETETSVLWIERATGHLVGRVELHERERSPKLFSVLPI
ncbi:MAG: hypothetical protein ABJE95_26115 [Byssovorax sp.]